MAICLCFRNDFHTLTKKNLIICPLQSEKKRVIKQAKRSTCSMHWVVYAYNLIAHSVQFSQFSRSVLSDSLQPHGLQHARPPCPSPTPRAYSNSCPLSRWCHPAISSSAILFSCLQSFPASGSFPVSPFFASGGQNIVVTASASVLLMNIQDWFPLGLTGLISLQSKGS